MGKVKTFVLFIFLLMIALFFYRLDIINKKNLSHQSVGGEMVQKAYEEAAPKVDASAIIKKELKAVGILTLLEGVEEYEQIIEEETWFSYRGITIDWRFKFAIAVNLEDLEVSARDDTIDVVISKEKLFLQYIEKTKDSLSYSNASLFAEKFSAQEIEALEKAVVERIESKIKTTADYWERAQKSLEVNITKICSSLEYYDIQFQWK
jgi:hypothetical protein